MQPLGRVALAFLAVDLVAILVVGPLPSIDDPPSVIAEFYTETGTRLAAQGYVRGLSMALLLWLGWRFAAALARSVSNVYGSLFRAAMVVVATIELVRVAVVAPVALQSERLGPDVVAAFHALGLVLGAVIAFPMAVGQLALATALRNSFPAWLPRTAIALAVAWLLTGVRSVATTHALWTAGTVVTFAWGVWLAAAAIVVGRAEAAWTRDGGASGG